MNRLDYIKLLKEALNNIIDSTVSTIEELESISDYQFESDKIGYIERMPFRPAVKKHIQKLEELTTSQAAVLNIKTWQAKSLSSQLFMSKAATQKAKTLHKEDVDHLMIQVTNLAQSLKETKAEFNKAAREYSACLRKLEREKEASECTCNILRKELADAKSVASDSYQGLKKVQSLIDVILHG